MTETPERWWEQSREAPDLTPIFGTGMGQALRLSSAATRVEIRFPWWDSEYEAAALLAWLRMASDGDTFFDLDQGWQIEVLRSADRFHFLDRDFDSGDILSNLVVDRAVFLTRLEQAVRAR